MWIFGTGFVVYALIVNAVGFCMYGIDKWKAVRGRWRISERALVLIAACGGSAGAILAMLLFRHKVRKKKFAVGIPAILILQIIILLWIRRL